MNYFVGDLAKRLNLSSEMIRYYEKMGVMKPNRQDGNNYRIYSGQDILLLVTVMYHQSFRIKIKEIQKMQGVSEAEYTPQFLESLFRFREGLKEELEYKNWLLMRVNEVIDRERFSSLNEGTFWMKQRPAHYRYPFLSIDETSGAQILLAETVTRFLFSENVLPFCDFSVEFCEKGEQWSLLILKEYGDYLKPPADGQEWVEGNLNACTVVNGRYFSAEACKMLEHYVNQKRYERTGRTEGVLCGGMPTGDWQYNVQIQMPVIKA